MSFNNITVRSVKCRHENVALATNDKGVTLCSVTYRCIGNFFLITGFSVNPIATGQEAQRSGDLIDALLANQAYASGISALLIMVPGQDQCEEVRKYSPAIPHTAVMGV